MNDEEVAAPPSPILMVVSMMLVLGSFFVIAWKMAAPVANTDTFFHLRLGAEFLNGWSPRDPGSVSSFATGDWVPSQWLGQIGLAAFEEWFGLPGVAWLSGTIILLLLLAIFLVNRAESSLLVAAVLLPITALGCAPALSARPQVLSYLFTLLTVWAWLRTQRTGRVAWWLVPMTWLWAMVHGMWVVSVITSLVAIAGLLLARTQGRPPLWKLALVPALSLLAAGLTPVGPAIYGAVIRVGSISKYYGEWGPTEFTKPATAFVAGMLVLLLLITLRSGPVDWLRLMLTLLGAGWLAYSNRTVPIAAVTLAPLLAGAMAQVLPRRRPSRAEVPLAVGGFLATVAGLALVVPHTSEPPPRGPNELTEAVDALPAGTGVLNEWDEGGYDMWLHPQLDFVMHGYGDMFTDAELERNFGLLTLQPGWDDDLRDLGVTHALLYNDGKLKYALVEQLGWEELVVEEPATATTDDKAQDEERLLSLLVAPDDWPTQ